MRRDANAGRLGAGAAAAGLVLLGWACAGPPIADPVSALGAAEASLSRGEGPAALELLEALDAEAFAGGDVERYKAALATALVRSGELWSAFEVIRDFEEQHPFSEYRSRVQDLEFEIGSRLLASDWRFLFFASDQDDGRVVLEHFALRYPQHLAAPDALRLLGEQAFADGDYALARRRFEDLVLKHSESEWSTLAKFRIAMASFHSLVGPAYDQRSMMRAHNELSEFLAEGTENPAFEREARAALATTREWLGEKHVRIADFYRTIGNPPGERLHLARAASYADTEPGRRAARRLAELPAAPLGDLPADGEGPTGPPDR